MCAKETPRRLLDKSQEMFMLAIELYNRPTIRYHAEGCAIFLCSAWELMLKAHLLKTQGQDSIYYKHKGNRTLSLEDCLRKIFTNENDHLRQNMTQIINLRNTSTHFITEEYEILYGPLLQSSVLNYQDKLRALHGIDISNRIPENYLNLSVKRDIINDEAVRAKYSPEVAERLLELYNAAVIPGEDGSSRYASYYETRLVVVKNVEKADLAVRIDKEANVGIAIAKQTVDLQNKYPYTARKVWEEVNRQLQKHGVTFTYRDRIQDKFNNHHWTIMVKFYNLKTDPRYGYNRATKGEKAPSYVYSQQTVELIVDSIRRNPHVLTDLLAKGFR